MQELQEQRIAVLDLLRAGDLRALKFLLVDMEPGQVVDIIKDLPPKEKLVIFRLLPKDLAADVFSELESDDQVELLGLFKDEMIKEILDEMDPDDRAELFDEMPANVVRKLIKLLSPEERELTMELLNYPPDSAGRMMNPHYIDLYEDMNVAEALVRIRRLGRELERETIYTPFVIDRGRRLVGVVDLKEIILSDSNVVISNIMKPDPVYVYTTTDREEVALIVQKYDLIAVPVVDSEHRLVGVITIDDVVDVIEEEVTEDIHHMASMNMIQSSYFHTPFMVFIKNRLPWLSLLLLMGSITANVIARYEDLLAAMPIIAAFFTTMSGTGGNVGSQSAAIVIRSMALGDIKPSDWPKVLVRELLVSLGISLPLAGLLLARAFLVSPHFLLNLGIAVSLVVVTVYANVLGALLPLMAVPLRVDPAVMAGPLLATLVDVSGIAIYFSIIRLFVGD